MTQIADTWMSYARSKYGVHEVLGDTDNPYIVHCLAQAGLRGQHDETAWCGAFMSDIMITTYPNHVLPQNPAAARSWLNYGVPVYPWRNEPSDLNAPIPYGAILILSRPPDPTHGHVTFYIQSMGDEFLCYGGNQNNQVGFGFYAKDRLLGVQWPEGIPLP